MDVDPAEPRRQRARKRPEHAVRALRPVPRGTSYRNRNQPTVGGEGTAPIQRETWTTSTRTRPVSIAAIPNSKPQRPTYAISSTTPETRSSLNSVVGPMAGHVRAHRIACLVTNPAHRRRRGRRAVSRSSIRPACRGSVNSGRYPESGRRLADLSPAASGNRHRDGSRSGCSRSSIPLPVSIGLFRLRRPPPRVSSPRSRSREAFRILGISAEVQRAGRRLLAPNTWCPCGRLESPPYAHAIRSGTCRD